MSPARTDKEQILEEKVASVQALLCSKIMRGRAAASGSDFGLPKRVPLIAELVSCCKYGLMNVATSNSCALFH